MHEPRHKAILAAVVATAVAAALLATSPGLPLGWDEGNAILRAEAAHWPYTTRFEGHPAFSGIVIATGQWLSSAWLPPREAARFGPILLLAAAAAAMFYRMAADYSLPAAFGAVAALLLQPRLFAHAHFASFDGPLVSCWVLAWAAFAPARRDWRWSLAWGAALGMTLSAKATGWLAPLPFVVWAIVERDRGAWRALAAGLPVALVTFVALNPPLWPAPVSGTATFLSLNLNRAAQGLNISTQFFGRMYNLDHPLPWHNALVWTAITVPVAVLVLAAAGLASVLRRWRSDGPGLLLIGHWAVLLIVRAFPFAPPHDAERLILPSFAFLAALAGVGADWLIQVSRRRRIALAAVGFLGMTAAAAVVRYSPQWLSYYNLLIGGLPGAAARGMEPTYYWDGLDREVLEWLNEHTGPDENAVFAAAPPENLHLLRRWGLLKCGCGARLHGDLRWYVVQHRPSAWKPEDKWLVEHCEPAFTWSIPSDGWGPWRLDVPLVSIYRFEDYAVAAKVSSSRAGDVQGPVESP